MSPQTLETPVWSGTRSARLDRVQRARVWLASLGLASLMSTGALADYVPLTAIWLLASSAQRVHGKPVLRVGLLAVAVSQYTLIGGPPLHTHYDASWMIALSALSLAPLLRRRPREQGARVSEELSAIAV